MYAHLKMGSISHLMAITAAQERVFICPSQFAWTLTLLPQAHLPHSRVALLLVLLHLVELLD